MPEPQARAGARYAVTVLTAMNLLNYIDRYVPSANKDLIKAELHLTDTQTSLPLTAFVWVYMIASPLFGGLADRWSRPKLIAAGVALWSLATAGAALAQDFWGFLGARALVGIGEAAYATLAPPLLAEFFPPERRNRVLTFFYLAIPVGAALGFAIGGVTGAHYGWRAAFLVCGLPGILAALFALRIRDPREALTSGHAPGVAGGPSTSPGAMSPEVAPAAWPEALRLLRGNAIYVCAVGGYTAVTFAQGAMADWFPSYLVRYPHLDEGQAGSIVGGITVVAGIGGTALGGWLADKAASWTRQPYLGLSAVSMAVAACLAAALFCAPADQPMLIYVLMFGASFFLWFYNGPINALIANATAAPLRARAFALSILCIHLLGDALSPTIVGLVSDGVGDLRTAMFLVPVAMAVGALVWARGWRRLPELAVAT